MEFNAMEMSTGTKYRVLVEKDELIRRVDQALKDGGLLTLPMGLRKPGTLMTINPQHVVSIDDGAAAL